MVLRVDKTWSVNLVVEGTRFRTIFGRYLRRLNYSAIRIYKHDFNCKRAIILLKWWERNDLIGGLSGISLRRKWLFGSELIIYRKVQCSYFSQIKIFFSPLPNQAIFLSHYLLYVNHFYTKFNFSLILHGSIAISAAAWRWCSSNFIRSKGQGCLVFHFLLCWN